MRIFARERLTGICAGSVFAGIGILVLFVTADYRRGTLRNIGPGFFPTVLGWLLCLAGVAIAMAGPGAAGSAAPSGGRVAWRAAAVPGALIVFSLLIDRARLLLAVAGLVGVAWVALPNLRARDVLILYGLLAAAAGCLFVYGLDLPASFLLPG